MREERLLDWPHRRPGRGSGFPARALCVKCAGLGAHQDQRLIPEGQRSSYPAAARGAAGNSGRYRELRHRKEEGHGQGPVWRQGGLLEDALSAMAPIRWSH